MKGLEQLWNLTGRHLDQLNIPVDSRGYEYLRTIIMEFAIQFEDNPYVLQPIVTAIAEDEVIAEETVRTNAAYAIRGGFRNSRNQEFQRYGFHTNSPPSVGSFCKLVACKVRKQAHRSEDTYV